MKIIQNKITSSKGALINNDKLSVLNTIFSDKGKSLSLINKLEKYSKKDLLFIINLLINCEINNEISKIIFNLYNKISERKIEIKFDDKVARLVKDKNLNNILLMFSKVKFKNLQYLYCRNCELTDNNLSLLKNLFSDSLVELDLSNNQISDITIFSEVKNLLHLKKLNLSNNKISDITCLKNDLNYKDLEYLDLSSNQIEKMSKISIPSLRYLTIMNNEYEIKEGVLDFLRNFQFKIDKVIIEKKTNQILFKYYNIDEKKEISLFEIKYPFEEDKASELLKTISFQNIKFLELCGLDNDIDFLSNESLCSLEILDFYSKISDITIFKDIKSKNIKKINFFDNEKISKGFNSLNVFKSMKKLSIEIQEIKLKSYLCHLMFEKPEFERYFVFNDLSFLKEEFLAKIENMDISQEILDNKNNWDFFSYENFISSFPIFKDLFANEMDINYNDKYICKTLFNGKHSSFAFTFTFEDKKFNLNDSFQRIELISLSNINLSDFMDDLAQKFKNIYNIRLHLYKNSIDSMEVFSKLKKMEVVRSRENICKGELLEFFEEDKFSMYSIHTEDNQIKINFKYPLNFYMNINKIEKLKAFSSCKEIIINNFQITDDDIKYLNLEKLDFLERLNLDDNRITNLNILDKINYQKIEKISLKNNLINTGIENIKNLSEKIGDIKLKSIKVSLKENMHVISFEYFRTYNKKFLSFDYLNDIRKNLDILNDIKYENYLSLDLSGMKLTNMNFTENKNNKTMSIGLNLNNNQIDDISILRNEKMGFYNSYIYLKKNPIRKGLNVLKSSYFRCVYIELDAIKLEKEYKICADFKYPNIELEFYINDINEIKNIIDFDNTFVVLKKNKEETKFLESDLLQNKSDEQKKLFDALFLFNKFLAENSQINVIQENGKTEFIRENNLIFSESNKNLLEKLFLYLQGRVTFGHFLSRLNLNSLDSNYEALIKNISFLYATELKLYKCNFNLNNLKSFYKYTIRTIDFSETSVNDIKELCQNCNIINLEALNLSNSPNISNLYELKNAKFNNLKKLYLSNNNLGDLNEIEMGEYQFFELTDLDLSQNHIESLGPILKAFKKLAYLNLENNQIQASPQLTYFYENYPNCKLLLKGNKL